MMATACCVEKLVEGSTCEQSNWFARWSCTCAHLCERITCYSRSVRKQRDVLATDNCMAFLRDFAMLSYVAHTLTDSRRAEHCISNAQELLRTCTL